MDKEAILASAKAAFGHITDDPVEQLARKVSQQQYAIQERTSVLNLNARQAAELAHLRATVEELNKELDAVKAERDVAYTKGLEDAAKVANEHNACSGAYIAAVIRAMIDTQEDKR